MHQTVIFQRIGEPETLALLSFEADTLLNDDALVDRLRASVDHWVGQGGLPDMIHYAGSDLNIGDLDSHGAFGDAGFQGALADHGLTKVTLVAVHALRIPYDRHLISPEVADRVQYPDEAVADG